MVKRKYRCSNCEIEFEAEEPLHTIPVSVVWCLICGKIVEEVDEKREDDPPRRRRRWL